MPFIKEIDKLKKSIDNIFNDLKRCLKNGMIISSIIFISTFLLGIVISGFNFFYALKVVRSALLILGSFGILAGSFLVLGKKNEKKLEHLEEWKENFKVLSYKTVIPIVSSIILLCGCVIDYLLILRL